MLTDDLLRDGTEIALLILEIRVSQVQLTSDFRLRHPDLLKLPTLSGKPILSRSSYP
jgi:hypothetical protein